MRCLIHSACFWSAMVLSGCIQAASHLGDSLFFPSPPLWHTLHLMLDFYLHYNVWHWPLRLTTLSTCWHFALGQLFLPGIIFVFLYEKYHTLLLLVTWLQHNTVLKVTPPRSSNARLPSVELQLDRPIAILLWDATDNSKSTHRRYFFLTDSLQLLHFDQNSK